MANVDEKKTVGASYLISFYTEVQTLTHYHSQYINLMLELESKYKDVNKYTDAEKTLVNNACQACRQSATKCFIQFISISKQLKSKVADVTEIGTAYNKIKNEFVIHRQDLENFVIKLNEVLVSDIIQELMVTSQNLVNDIYGDTNTQTS